jgi:hypothetical protein
MAFFYIGFTAKHSIWIFSGVVYLISFIGLQYMGISGMHDPISNILVTLFMAIWIISIIHALAIRGDYLTRLEIIKKYKNEFQEEYLSEFENIGKKSENAILKVSSSRIEFKSKKSKKEISKSHSPRIDIKKTKDEKEVHENKIPRIEFKRDKINEINVLGTNLKFTEILSDSFRYPLTNLKRYIILGILLFFSFLIIPGILANGYMLRIIKHSFKDSNDFPPFNEWLSLFEDGIKYLIVNIVYLSIPLFVTIFISIIIVSMAPISDFNTFFNTFVSVLIIIGLIILTIPYFLSLIALPHIVKKNKLGSLFEIKNLLNVIRRIGWIKYLAAVVLLTLFSILVSALSFIPQILHMNQLLVFLISAVLSLFIGPYLLSFHGKLLALLYQEGIEQDKTKTEN